MYNVDKMMEVYDEALEEMMGAEKYTKMAMHSKEKTEKSMYHNIAKQELEHADILIRSIEHTFVDVPETDNVHRVWLHLRRHIHEWRVDIERKMST